MAHSQLSSLVSQYICTGSLCMNSMVIKLFFKCVSMEMADMLCPDLLMKRDFDSSVIL